MCLAGGVSIVLLWCQEHVGCSPVVFVRGKFVFFEQFCGLVLLWSRAECRKLCSCWRGQFGEDRMLVAQDIGFLFDGEQVKRFGAGVNL